MTRQSRMVTILLVMAVVGIVALAMVAKRYQSLRETHSDPQIPETEDVRPEQAQHVQGSLGIEEKLGLFVEIRTAVREVIDSKKKISDLLIMEWDGHSVPDHYSTNVFLVHILMTRKTRLEEAGMANQEYMFIRDQYRAWSSGEGELLQEWREAFDSHAEMLEPADLGRYERLDIDAL